MTLTKILYTGTLLVACLVLAMFALPRTATMPAQTKQSMEPQQVEKYVTDNISKLSPVHEQVGGTFYVTSIHAEAGAGTVSYEDGHNAYTADFTYSSDAQNTVRVDSFVVRE
jgi:hypothetical protein